MRHLVTCCGLALLAACAKSEQQQTATTSSTISLADVAGKWTLQTRPQNSDSVLVTFELHATGDSAGWTYHFPQRDPVPVHIMAVGGDSIVTHAGPYASVLRPGVQVTVHSVMRLKDGKMVGTSEAHYASAAGDSVVVLRTEGTRAP
jgi:hypothetical protein